MLENKVEFGLVVSRCHSALADWGLDAEERRAVLTGGVGDEEPDAPVVLETRLRHIVDVDRAIWRMVDRPSLVGVWLRLPQEALNGMSPLDAITSHVSGLRFVRTRLLQEQLERGFA